MADSNENEGVERVSAGGWEGSLVIAGGVAYLIKDQDLHAGVIAGRAKLETEVRSRGGWVGPLVGSGGCVLQSGASGLARAPATQPVAVVEIRDIVYDGEVARSESDEYVVIANVGGAEADLSGWVLDAGDLHQTFTFPVGASLAPGRTIRVYTDQLDPASGGYSFGSSRALWNNEGDEGSLFDASGRLVSSFVYNPRAS